MFDRGEFERWIAQSDKTLTSAEHDLSAGAYNWTCFKAQQAAECAVKALLRATAVPAVGYSVLKLMEALANQGFEIAQLTHCARIIDAHYLPTRYPDVYPQGSPFEFYDEDIAREAIKCAQQIIESIKVEARRRE
ncbi:MAG TPA: HEPN domain-containing protein [Anaerolineae bacterium]|nr:HEPN domain-containing protein [Anaerolineae bacterium]